MASKRIPSVQRGVRLPIASGTEFLRLTLQRADRGHLIPNSKSGFERTYARTLAGVEQARRALPRAEDRVALARDVFDQASREMRYSPEGQSEVRLSDFVAQSVRPSLTLTHQIFSRTAKPSLDIPYRGNNFGLNYLEELTQALLDNGSISEPAGEALRWVNRVALGQVRFDELLKGHNIVILGGNAELSPAELLLKMGANVLIVDLSDPKVLRSIDAPQYSGQLQWIQGGANLLEQPDQITRTIADFARERGAVHLLNMAYAGGDNREWRLMAAQNAIATAIPAPLVLSIGTFVSPSVPAPMTPEDFLASKRRFENQRFHAMWQRLYPALVEVNGITDSQGLAPIAMAIEQSQGGSYMGAQIVEKIHASEVWLADGHQGSPILVSANIAGITATRSMDKWRYRFGFAGAQALGIDIFEPAFTANVNGLLYVHDLLNMDHHDRLRANPNVLWERQVHGGIYRQPYSLASMFLWARVYGVPSLPWTLKPKYPR